MKSGNQGWIITLEEGNFIRNGLEGVRHEKAGGEAGLWLVD